MNFQSTTMQALREASVLDAGSGAYLERLYEDYLNDPSKVPSEWRNYFEQLPKVDGNVSEARHLAIQTEIKNLVRQRNASQGVKDNQDIYDVKHFKTDLLQSQKQTRVCALIDAYRLLGHLYADIDPLKMREKAPVPELMLAYYRLSGSDLKVSFESGSLPGPSTRPLQQIMDDLKRIYCETVASEFMHISDSPERIWVQEQLELVMSQIEMSPSIQRRVLDRVIAAEGLEKHLAAHYPGAKRFSIEGTEGLLVALDTLIQQGGVIGIKEIAIGMAHRGRLNILVNILGETPNQLFDEFEGKDYGEQLESGDVKYHQGFSSNVSTPGGTVHLALAFNPAHLEIVSPVVYGSVRAKQERRKDNAQHQVLSMVIHGDAAFSGQGIVMETLNMSQTRGFKIGGTIHIIVNNQIGFTTSNPEDSRSTLYCSDIGKMMGIPIFHVNANDLEAIYKVAGLALQYRAEFKKDVIIDLVGYRRQGHNEADEPSVTQPLMYRLIRHMPTVCKLYADKLIADKVLSEQEIDKMIQEYRNSLESRQHSVVSNLVDDPKHEFTNDWEPYYAGKEEDRLIKTAVSLSVMKSLAQAQLALPSGFSLHPLVLKIIEDRHKMTCEELPIDWGYAETLAYATLLNEGYLVRLSGEDSGRGAFFHRHVILYDQNDGKSYIPLNHLSDNQAPFTIVNSLLSEAAVLAFEYGFAAAEPRGLIVWEAQFGDFANGAQVVIDQFISSGEQKWGRLCGLTLFLPHGYEGQGPEHSSARLERYLQLCAQRNIQVCVPTTPAQIFHLLRRQVLQSVRKPLIVMTPKSLLRHKLAVSSLNELEKGKFLSILPEIDNLVPFDAHRVILCSGKVYYDLLEKRRAENLNIVILRVEQLYPFPEEEVKKLLQVYNCAKEIVWCQEEPKNQGAWYYIKNHLYTCLSGDQQLRYVGRGSSAAPAVGYSHLHQEQRNALLKEALG
jgi:2-oxoglutarate dehydrogenase E1 component